MTENWAGPSEGSKVPPTKSLIRNLKINISWRTESFYLNDQLNEMEDKDFIERRTEGYEEFKQEVLSQDIDKLAEISGVDKELARKAAIAYAKAPNAMEFHGLGVTEHSQGTHTVLE